MGLQQLLPYQDLLGIKKATDCLVDAIKNNQRLLIIGDFDADGATSTAIAVTALTQMGAQHVDYIVPNRFEFGYGLTPEIVEVSLSLKPDVLITVDNGIASCEGVAVAKAHGLTVVITDHHLPGQVLPDADAIVNPNQHGDLFLSKQLAGCGVIFYVMMALRAALRAENWFVQRGIPEPKLAECLDLVALGTVADVVPLDQNNRILVKQGLARIQAGVCRPGILALLQVANRQMSYVQTSDLAYAIAPRLNAAGRLTDMRVGIACLLAPSMSEGMRLAHALDGLNQERREIESSMQIQAIQEVRKLHVCPERSPTGVVLFDPSWHQGVIGIVAGRIKERLHRPVIAFAQVSEAELKGSARSIPGLNIRDALDAVATRYPHLIHKFGGHAMAAGLSIPLENFVPFREAFERVVLELIQACDLEAIIYTDGCLLNDEFNVSLATLIKQACPWGQGFPEPIFEGRFQLVEQRLLQGKHLKMRLGLADSPRLLDAIYFNVDVERWPNHRCEQVHMAYRLDVNHYGGNHHLQLMVEYLLAD